MILYSKGTVMLCPNKSCGIKIATIVEDIFYGSICSISQVEGIGHEIKALDEMICPNCGDMYYNHGRLLKTKKRINNELDM